MPSVTHALHPLPAGPRAGGMATTARSGAETPPPRRAPAAAAHDTLTPLLRHGLVAMIVVAHGAAGWGLMQVSAVREAVAEAAPLFVSLIAPPLPVPPALASPPPSPLPSLSSPPPPRRIVQAPPPPQPLVTVAPPLLPAPATFAAPPPPTEPLPPVADVPPPATAAAAAPVIVAAPPSPPSPPSPVPAPPAPPKSIPASAVQYLEPPAPEYPRVSRRLGEAGRVLVRVYIDEAGLPRQVVLAQSSGFARLDEAALAAMRQARFKPYTENGRATAGWAPAPIDFELEN